MAKKRNPQGKNQRGGANPSQRLNTSPTPQPSAAQSRRASRRAIQERERKRRQLMMLGGVAVLALLVVGLAILLTRGGGSDEEIKIPPTRDASIPVDGRTIGNPDAPVKIVEYADFQCPACGQFAEQIEPMLIDEYIKTGLVHMTFNDFPFLDDRSGSGESDRPSEAAMCAMDQGLFWQYHDIVFHNQSGENRGGFSNSRLKAFARHVPGLDTGAFDRCFDDRTHQNAVQELYTKARESGINSTPTFDINGNIVSGANYPVIKQAIDAALGR